jgi:hypothetical protein
MLACIELAEMLRADLSPSLRLCLRFYLLFFVRFAPFRGYSDLTFLTRPHLRKSAFICGLSRRRLGEGGFVCLLFAALCEILFRVLSCAFAVVIREEPPYPIRARTFARTSASCSGVTRPFCRAFRIRQSRLFT